MSTTKIITLITGANGGLGYTLAKLLLESSNNHVLLGARSPSKGAQAVSDLQALKLSGTVELVGIDVNSHDSVRDAAEQVSARHGHIDNLVNNAAIAVLPEGTPMHKQLDATFRTNAIGAQLVTELFAPLLEKSARTPRIVHITSGAGSIARRLDPSGALYRQSEVQYRASKAALNMIGACHAVEYGEKFGAKVFLYCPGFCVSNLSGFNRAENGAKPSEEGMGPVVDILGGSRDADSGKFVNSDGGEYPW